jgi:hypothetical protein
MSIKVWNEPFKREIIEELHLQAAKLFRRFQLPECAEEWPKKRDSLEKRLRQRLNIRSQDGLPLDAKYGRQIDFGTHTVTPVIYQSRRDFYVTASLYKPKGDGPFPAIVIMHGHNQDGRINERQQATASRYTQKGYVCLVVDAFGSGERSMQHGEFEYHGGSVGGMLLTLGETLLGIQVMDNSRAIDLLVSLPFVDAENIGATGASGGGNQTMYLAAFDQRVKAAAPVVSVGSYQSYIGGANCVCELIPDGLEICEESALLAMVAPRALLVCNAMHDNNHTFYVSEMLRSFGEARKVFQAMGAYKQISNLAFNGPHSYPTEVQAAVLGFFDLHLKNTGHGLPCDDLPVAKTMPREELFFFPRGQRDKKVCSIGEYMAREGARLRQTAKGTIPQLKQYLRISEENNTATYLSTEKGWQKHTLETSRGRILPFLFKPAASEKCQISAAPGGKDELEQKGRIAELEETSDSILLFDPWGCGECGYIGEIQNIWLEQHQLSRALLWLGRRLLGEWTMDYLAAVKFVKEKMPQAEICLEGLRDSAVAALYATLLAPEKIAKVRMIDAPCTFVRTEKSPVRVPLPTANFPYVPPDFFSMALCLPDILQWGDIDYAIGLANCPVEQINSRRLDGSPC